MDKFVFKLESLYNYRQRLEELSRKDLSLAVAQLEEEEKKLDRLREVYRKSSAEMDEKKMNGGGLEEIGLYSNYIEGLRLHISEKEKLIAEYRAVFEQRRDEFIEVSKDRQVMEKLKERSLESYTREKERQEQKDTDEIVSGRFARGESDEI